MSKHHQINHPQIRKSVIRLLAAATCGLILVGAGMAKAGGPLSEDEILHALTPPPPPVAHTRTLSLTPAKDPEQQKFIKSLRSSEMRSRSLSREERDEVADIATQRP